MDDFALTTLSGHLLLVHAQLLLGVLFPRQFYISAFISRFAHLIALFFFRVKQKKKLGELL